VLAALVAPGCAKVVVDDEASGFCLHWEDADQSPGGPAEDLRCEVLVSGPNAEVEPPPTTDHHLAYVCVDAPEEGCGSPRVAEPSASVCIESEVGDLCGGDGPPFGGSCTSVTIWSMCGPDPAASGGCCYYANVLQTTILSLSDD